MSNSLLTSAHQSKLLKKWAPILESGKAIQSDETKIALAQILENTRNFYNRGRMVNEAGITQAGVVGDHTVGGGILNGTGIPGEGHDFYLQNIVMPMLRRIMPDLMANELVGVQPMNGPIGFALAFRPKYGNIGGIGNGQLTATVGKEIGYAPTDTRWTGLSGENLSAVTGTGTVDLTGDFWKAYAGNDGKQWLGAGADLGEGSEYATLNETLPNITFGLVKREVVAKTRKLAANWSPELAEDMQAMHGIDVEREMINTLTYEVGAEIDRQIVTEMVKAAIIGGATSEWSPISADGLDQMGRLATLLTQITIEANQIAIRTKRGNANFVVTTPRVCALLQQLSMNKFTSFKTSAAMPTVPDTGVGALAKVGLINDDSMLLVRDSYVQGSNDYVLMGYKGKQAGDSGIIYCPYIPLQLSKVLQPGSFTPSVACRTRYGVMSNPWDAKNYYAFMKISDLVNGKYTWDGERYFVGPTSPLALNTGFDSPVMG